MSVDFKNAIANSKAPDRSFIFPLFGIDLTRDQSISASCSTKLSYLRKYSSNGRKPESSENKNEGAGITQVSSSAACNK